MWALVYASTRCGPLHQPDVKVSASTRCGPLHQLDADFGPCINPMRTHASTRCGGLCINPMRTFASTRCGLWPSIHPMRVFASTRCGGPERESRFGQFHETRCMLHFDGGGALAATRCSSTRCGPLRQPDVGFGAPASTRCGFSHPPGHWSMHQPDADPDSCLRSTRRGPLYPIDACSQLRRGGAPGIHTMLFIVVGSTTPSATPRCR